VRRRLTGERGDSLLPRVRRAAENLLVYSPPATLPGNLHVRALNSLVHGLAWRGLRRAVPPVDAAPVDVVTAWPPSFELARRVRHRRIVYDCLDLFPAFETGLRHRLLASIEDDLARAAFAVVVTSRDLERRWSRRHPRVVRIPNGVDLALFGRAASALEVAHDIAALPRPRLGYIGTVGPWVDLPLLEHVARHRPGCSIVMIGPAEPGVRAHGGPANLRLLGERPYASVPAYLAGMDVLLIPFRMTDLTRAVNPIKLYEYCATGKPIAATPIEEVAAEGAVCHLGAGEDAFLKAVDEAVLEAEHPDPVRADARQRLALASGWDARVEAYAGVLDRNGDA
jgi:glycosyltransferase involved in cell wall biosynthesis